MNQWPFSGKSLWESLEPGQKWAVVLGVPIMVFMQRSLSQIIDYLTPWVPIRAIFLLLGIPLVAYVYVAGIGIFIAAIIQAIFYKR
jgi:hypothetical protein